MNKQQIFKQFQNIIFSVRVKKDYLSQFKLKSVSKKELLKDSMTGAGMIEAYQKNNCYCCFYFVVLNPCFKDKLKDS